MKSLRLLCVALCFLSANAVWAREASVPNRWGVYIVDVSSGAVGSMGDFYEWQLSPDGRFLVGGRETGTKSPFYEVGLISTAGGTERRLERFRIGEPTGAIFQWSPDSARVRVETDRNNDGKSEIKTFAVGRASTVGPAKRRPRTLSELAMKRLKARYSQISDIVFSPGGTRVVAYLSRSSYMKADYDGGLWMFTPDGRNLKRLTRNEPYSDKHDFFDVEPHWLSDGKRLAFRRTSFEDEGI